jgi:hypothetical protein
VSGGGCYRRTSSREMNHADVNCVRSASIDSHRIVGALRIFFSFEPESANYAQTPNCTTSHCP